MTETHRAIASRTTTSGLAVREVQPIDPDRGTHNNRVVLVHGAMDRSASFRKLERALPTATVLSYDRRGYAGSIGVAPSADFDDHVADLEEVLGGLPAVVFGHSLGGALALTVAARRPNLVRAVAVFEPPFPWMAWWPMSSTQRTAAELGPAAAAERFLQRFLGERIWSRLPEAHRAERRAEGPALVADMAALRNGQPFDSRALRVPVVIGQGERSMPFYGQGIAEFCAGLPADACFESVIIAGAQHGAHLSHPRDLASLVERATALVGAGRLPGNSLER